MIDIIMLTGFLGAGKTTLLQTLLTAYKDKKVGVIVNEFGEINIDARLVESEGMQMAELSNGSIFCACIKDKFVDSLIKMSIKDLDYLFIEASGLADPSNMGAILDGIKHKTLNELKLTASLCVIDAAHFLGLVGMLSALGNQIAYANAVVVNKADLVDEATLLKISDKIQELNPGVGTFVTSYCKLNLDEVMVQLKETRKPSGETTNTYSSRPSTIILRCQETLSLDALKQFLAEIAPSSYRIKGFAETDKGIVEISAVVEDININDWPEAIKQTEIVVISSVGMKMLSLIIAASNKYLDGKLKL